MSGKPTYRCRLCGRTTDQPVTCCGESAMQADEVHVESPAEPWICPVCGAQSDNPMTCCGKRAVRNPDFKG